MGIVFPFGKLLFGVVLHRKPQQQNTNGECNILNRYLFIEFKHKLSVEAKTLMTVWKNKNYSFSLCTWGNNSHFLTTKSNRFVVIVFTLISLTFLRVDIIFPCWHYFSVLTLFFKSLRNWDSFWSSLTHFNSFQLISAIFYYSKLI